MLFDEDGVVREAATPTVVIDTSTLTPDAARRVHADLHAHAVAFLDAPVSGGPGGAAGGSLVIMVGGDREVLDRAGRLFQSLGTVFHCGGPGAGQVCKACNQLVVVGTIELVAEALVLAEAGGLDPALVRSALMGGYAASRVLDLHGARMLSRDFAPGGRAKFNLKDIDAIEGLAAANGLALPAFAAAATQINRLIDGGGGDLDNAALITVLEDARMVPNDDRPLRPHWADRADHRLLAGIGLVIARGLGQAGAQVILNGLDAPRLDSRARAPRRRGHHHARAWV